MTNSILKIAEQALEQRRADAHDRQKANAELLLRILKEIGLPIPENHTVDDVRTRIERLHFHLISDGELANSLDPLDYYDNDLHVAVYGCRPHKSRWDWIVIGSLADLGELIESGYVSPDYYYSDTQSVRVYESPLKLRN